MHTSHQIRIQSQIHELRLLSTFQSPVCNSYLLLLDLNNPSFTKKNAFFDVFKHNSRTPALAWHIGTLESDVAHVRQGYKVSSSI